MNTIKTRKEVTVAGAQRLREAHGRAKLLAIGVSNYDPNAGFAPLSQCANDALTVRDVFQNNWQLNPDKGYLKAIVSGTTPSPSRGVILKEIRLLAATADENDRIVVFYSGHGHRIGNEFYLVPEDAYTDDDPAAMVNYEEMLSILKTSRAKQIVILLDACLSGPLHTGGKLVAADISNNYLADYLKKTTGTVVLSSSSRDQASYSQSPNPKLSLFTYYLTKGLAGDTQALDQNGFVTINSLFQYVSCQVDRTSRSYQKEQLPQIDTQSSGELVLGDYGRSIIDPSTFDATEFPVNALVAKKRDGFHVEYVLTEIRNWGAYSEGYLAGKVNSNLGTYLSEELGKHSAALINDMGFAVSDIGVDGSELTFPGGRFLSEYEPNGKKSGFLISKVELDADWLKNPDKVVKLLSCLKFEPTEITFRLSKRIAPQSLISGLGANGWELGSTLLDRVVVDHANGANLVIEPQSLSFRGISLQQLFGLAAGSDKTRRLAYDTLALLGS